MNYLIDDNVLEEIRNRVDIVSLVERYVDLKKRGTNYLGLCPFHNEKTPSFTVSEQKFLSVRRASLHLEVFPL